MVNMTESALHISYSVDSLIDSLAQLGASLDSLAVGGVAEMESEGSRHSKDFGQGVVDFGHDLGIQVGIDSRDKGMQRLRVVALALDAAHPNVLDAADVVGEVGDRHIAVGRLDIGNILAVPSGVDFGAAHLVGDIDATLEDGDESGGAGAIGTSRLASIFDVPAIAVARASDVVGKLDVVEFIDMALRGVVAQPADFELIAAVAEVAGHSDDIGPLVGRDIGDLLRLSIGKKDELDAMETEQGIAEALASDDIAVIGVESGYHSRTAHKSVEGTFVQGPRIDVRVDAEIAGGAEEEGLAPLPPSASLEESLASGIQAILRRVDFESGQLVGQRACRLSQSRIGGSDGVVDELRSDGGGVFVGVDIDRRFLIVLARSEKHCSGGNDRQQRKFKIVEFHYTIVF